MKRILGLGLLLLLVAGASYAQALPPKAVGQVYVLVAPGQCPTGTVEVGTYKPELNQIWSRTPKQFVSTCQLFAEDAFVARYRLAVRCVDPNTKSARSDWVRSLSGLGKPWPPECPGFPPANPLLPAVTSE